MRLFCFAPLSLRSRTQVLDPGLRVPGQLSVQLYIRPRERAPAMQVKYTCSSRPTLSTSPPIGRLAQCTTHHTAPFPSRQDASTPVHDRCRATAAQTLQRTKRMNRRAPPDLSLIDCVNCTWRACMLICAMYAK
ncbi:hypothetical protein BKA80DRAFT_284818 [Phyllosticta citrichinensis]